MATFLQRVMSTLTLPRTKPFAEMGSSGTPVWGGMIFSPDKSTEWKGQRRYALASEIAVNVSIVAAGLYYFLNLVARPSWNVISADPDSAAANELADFTRTVMEDIETPWPNVVRRAGMYKFHGFSVQEWTAVKRNDGAIGFRDIEVRPQHTIEEWVVTSDGAVEGVFQRSPQTGEMLGLPRSKVIYIVEDTLSDSPEGMGAFRHLLEPYNRLKMYLDLEARAFERDLRGIPVGRAPLSLINKAVASNKLSSEKAQTLIQGLEDFVKLAAKKSDTGMLLDSQIYESTAQDGPKVSNVPLYDLSLLQGSAQGLAELASAIDRIQREMARIIGTEILMMGDQGGNRALATDKSRNLYMGANAVLGNITACFEHDMIGPLWVLNAFPEELKPSLKAEDVSFREVGEITEALSDMASSGAVLSPEDPAINDVRALLGLSEALPVDPEIAALPGGEDEGVDEDEEEEEEEDVVVEEDEVEDEDEDEDLDVGKAKIGRYRIRTRAGPKRR